MRISGTKFCTIDVSDKEIVRGTIKILEDLIGTSLYVKDGTLFKSVYAGHGNHRAVPVQKTNAEQIRIQNCINNLRKILTEI